MLAALALGLLIAPDGAAPTQGDGPPDAMSLANELLERGARRFEAKDARAMVDQYAEDATITLRTHDDEEFRTNRYEGAEPIRKLYENLFANAGPIRATNVVEYASLVGDRFLVIGGTFEPDRGAGTLLQFVQVRRRDDDGRWRIASLQLIPIPGH